MIKPQRISVSTLANFGSCRRRFKWDQEWLSPKPNSNLVVGRVVHSCLDQYYQCRRQELSFDQTIQRVMIAFPEILDRETREFRDLSFLPESSFISGLVYNYMLYDDGDQLRGKIKAIEKSIAVPIPGHPNVCLSGRIDLVIEDEIGGIWIVDHKTSNTKPSLGGLEVDEQTTAYCWLYWKDTGIAPRGVVYNVIVKALPKIPIVLQSGKLSKDKSQSTTYSLYKESIRQNNLEETDYADILDHLGRVGWSNYYARESAYRSLIEMNTFESRLFPKVRDILSTLSNFDEAYPSPSTYTCSYCPYLGICKSAECGEDYQLILESEFTRYERKPHG
jgi:hypothetical protein